MDEHKVTKKSCTAILCELTRLKSQQKYLECSQVKSNPDNFGSVDEDVNGSGNGDGVYSIIREIEDLKITLARDLEEKKMSVKREVENMWIFVNAIRDDVLDGERLKQYSVQSIRDRILSINSMLGKLNEINEQTLKDVQRKIVEIENDTKFLLK
ncbi:uncharacterized protein LOC129906831 [Episyrphus balteatus]|uniref:uncharacterized protein LOC129906831 n=1 Tax=Episyrphus balteatus TaxID=286459 RepID=UPI002485907D|nr:uncharacterized protein LOC129906831 [Episyrphus balteatus]